MLPRRQPQLEAPLRVGAGAPHHGLVRAHDHDLRAGDGGVFVRADDTGHAAQRRRFRPLATHGWRRERVGHRSDRVG